MFINQQYKRGDDESLCGYTRKCNVPVVITPDKVTSSSYMGNKNNNCIIIKLDLIQLFVYLGTE
jgi:hypothetical protein